jgi:wyosine [tRNA(Phe)-imidazoG37] synthetase (radical SAM superfamily)
MSDHAAEALPSLTFGPIRSRRLGWSLGVNPIPPKHCSYACVYCQLGRTSHMSLERRAFRSPREVATAARRHLHACRASGRPVDALTVVPDGEPTLDVNLGRLVAALAGLGPPVAVITNGSLLDRDDVRADLARAHWVSVKVDAGTDEVWRSVDRPHGRLRFAHIRAGAEAFAAEFGGTLVTETMLVPGCNDSDAALGAVADRLAALRPAVAYLAVPTRPPAEGWVSPPTADDLVRAHAILSESTPTVELLTGEPEELVTASSDLERDLVAITAVHPLDEGGVVALGGGKASALDAAAALVGRGRLAEVVYGGRRFFVRAPTRSASTRATRCPPGRGRA